jgi:hypothetical protein
VRHSASLEKYEAYITNNPVKAGLCEGEYTLSNSHVGLASRQSRAGEPGPEFTDFKPDYDRQDAGPT